MGGVLGREKSGIILGLLTPISLAFSYFLRFLVLRAKEKRISRRVSLSPALCRNVALAEIRDTGRDQGFVFLLAWLLGLL